MFFICCLTFSGFRSSCQTSLVAENSSKVNSEFSGQTMQFWKLRLHRYQQTLKKKSISTEALTSGAITSFQFVRIQFGLTFPVSSYDREQNTTSVLPLLQQRDRIVTIWSFNLQKSSGKR